VLTLAEFVRQNGYKTAWYSGRADSSANACNYFDYIKLGAYIERLGLSSPTTNQRLYRVVNGETKDITAHFWPQKRSASGDFRGEYPNKK
jgi:hypothetical protein